MRSRGKPAQPLPPAIRRAPIDQFTIYEISEGELEILERGSGESLLLNFAILLISTAVSFTVTLVTSTIASDRVFTVFVVFTVVGYIIGVVLAAIWLRTHRSAESVAETIRRRLPPDGVQEIESPNTTPQSE